MNLWMKSPMAQAHNEKTIPSIIISSVLTKDSSGGNKIEQFRAWIIVEPVN